MIPFVDDPGALPLAILFHAFRVKNAKRIHQAITSSMLFIRLPPPSCSKSIWKRIVAH